MSYENLKNKNVFITGASSGLGREIAIDLSNHGCNLYLTGRDGDRLKETTKMCNQDVKIFYLKGDLTKNLDYENIVENCENVYGNIDILINCASYFQLKKLPDTTDKEFDYLMKLNVKVPFQLIKFFSPWMVKKKWGRIVNVGSSSSFNGSPDAGAYAITKHALSGLTKSYYDILKKDNIRIYDVCPGSLRTPMGEKDYRQDYNTFIDPKEVAEYISFIMKFDKELITKELKLTRNCL